MTTSIVTGDCIEHLAAVPDALTERQQAVLDWIAEYLATNTFAPTLREVASAMGCGVNGVAGHLAALKAKGRLTWTPRQARSIRIVQASHTSSNTPVAVTDDCHAPMTARGRNPWVAASGPLA